MRKNHDMRSRQRSCNLYYGQPLAVLYLPREAIPVHPVHQRNIQQDPKILTPVPAEIQPFRLSNNLSSEYKPVSNQKTVDHFSPDKYIQSEREYLLE